MTIPWGLFQWAVDHPELGWVLLFLWLLFELRSDRGRLYQLDKKITGSIIVIRALAQKEDAIDESKVDDYLVENGMEPRDFFVEGHPQSPGSKPSFEDNSGTSDESLRGETNNSPNNDERSAQ